MSLGWLKRYMPRSLYARAALILVLPIVLLQLVVSVTFIQRHFEDVTIQMTQTVIRELRLVNEMSADAQSTTEALDGMAPLLETLQIGVTFISADLVPETDYLRWYDFSGRVMIRTLRAAVPTTYSVLLPDDREVVIFFDTRLGPAEVRINRRRVSAAAPHQLPLTMVSFGLLMTVIAFIYMRNQLRPISRLAAAAQAFGRGRVEPYSPSGAVEIRTAGNAFLDMRSRIERHIEQRTLMLSGVSHDLRTPLTRMRLELSMLDDDMRDTLMRDVDDMQGMIDAFLEFSRDQTVSEPEPVDPIALAEELVSEAQRGGQPVTLFEASGEGTVMLRPVAMRRALDNLIGNAVRYGGRAEVSVTLTERSLRFRVEDDGPGIPEDQRADAQRPFTRLDAARNQDKGSGVGLGLAIATDIARAHGGTLRLGTSERLGGLRADIVIAR